MLLRILLHAIMKVPKACSLFCIIKYSLPATIAKAIKTGYTAISLTAERRFASTCKSNGCHHAAFQWWCPFAKHNIHCWKCYTLAIRRSKLHNVPTLLTSKAPITTLQATSAQTLR